MCRILRQKLANVDLSVCRLDGNGTHGADTRWWDVRRDNAAAANGIVTLRYSWFDVTQTPGRVAAEVARVLADRGFTGAHPYSPSCPVGQVTEQRRPPA